MTGELVACRSEFVSMAQKKPLAHTRGAVSGVERFRERDVMRRFSSETVRLRVDNLWALGGEIICHLH
jgi:hypothetical protein